MPKDEAYGEGGESSPRAAADTMIVMEDYDKDSRSNFDSVISDSTQLYEDVADIMADETKGET